MAYKAFPPPLWGEGQDEGEHLIGASVANLTLSLSLKGEKIHEHIGPRDPRFRGDDSWEKRVPDTFFVGLPQRVCRCRGIAAPLALLAISVVFWSSLYSSGLLRSRLAAFPKLRGRANEYE